MRLWGVLCLLAAASAVRAQSAPPIWTIDGGLTRVTDSNVNRFFEEFPVDAREASSDAAWRWTGGLRFTPRFPQEVPLRFEYHITDQVYENLTAFNYVANNVSLQATLPRFLGLYPRVSGGADWSRDSQGLTGNDRWGAAGLDWFGRAISAIRLDATYMTTTFDLTDRNANMILLRGLVVKAISNQVSLYGQYGWTQNEANNAAEFSYHENLGEGGILYKPQDWVETSLRYQIHLKNYYDVDPRFGLRRKETLHDAYATLRLNLVPGLLAAFASYQWEENFSNADIKNYTADVFSFGVQVSY